MHRAVTAGLWRNVSRSYGRLTPHGCGCGCVCRRIDLAVRLGLLADSTLIAQQLMRTYYRVCASPNYLQRYGHPERPSDIEAHNCLLFPLPGFRSRWIFRDRDGVISEVPVHGRTMHLE